MNGHNHSELGIILIGNSGVGKSFLANILLEREVFEHKCSSSSVTHVTEYEPFEIDGFSYAVFNIPGLIEDNQQAIDRNKQEIHKAFQQRPNSIIIFVFNGGSSGHLCDEDFVAFNAIHNAYNFQVKSLVIAINNLPSDRDPDYAGETIVKLERLLNMSKLKVCFLNRIATRDPNQRKQLSMQLLNVVLDQCEASVHTKSKEIELTSDEIKKLKIESDEKQKKFDQEMSLLHDEIAQKNVEFSNYQARTANSAAISYTNCKPTIASEKEALVEEIMMILS